jgi:DNA-binding transcriptional regulator YhcF (GntR family)
MQITQKLRKDILFALPKLSNADAIEIATKCDVHRDTVYRAYRKLKGDDPLEATPVIIALAELAASQKKDVVSYQKKLRTLEKQLSTIK